MTIKLPVRLAAVGLVVALSACGGGRRRRAPGPWRLGLRERVRIGNSLGHGIRDRTGFGACMRAGGRPRDRRRPARRHVEQCEWSLETDEETVSGGLVQFVAFNQGEEPHELVIVRGKDPGSLPVADDGTVDEDALPAGAFVGEIEAFPAGTSCSGVFELKRGEYVLFCNILETEGDEAESHFEKGMSTTISVR